MKNFCCIFLIFLISLLSCCSPKPSQEGAPSVDFLSSADGIFPFYTIGTDNMLYRAQKNGVFPTSMRVSYSIFGKETHLVKYFKQTDTLIFASEIFVQGADVICSLFMLQGNELTQIYDNVLFNSVKISTSASIAFITSEKKLIHYAKGNLSHIDDNVLRCEFASQDKIIYMLDQGYFNQTSFLYPTFCATDDYRFFIADSFDIVTAPNNQNLVFLLKDTRTVQKRASSCDVADCIVLLDGQELAQIPSVVLSQFLKNNLSNFLLSCDEAQPTLQFLLYKIDQNGPSLLAKNVLSGKSASFLGDAFAFEALTQNGVKTFVAQGYIKEITQENVTIDNVFCFNNEIYTLFSDNLCINDKVILKDVEHVNFDKEGLVCFVLQGQAYSVYLVKDTSARLLAKNVVLTDFVLEDEYFYYFSGDNVSQDLFVSSSSGTVALLPSTDTSLSFISLKGDIAAVRKDDKVLYYSLRGQTYSTFLPVKLLIK